MHSDPSHNSRNSAMSLRWALALLAGLALSLAGPVPRSARADAIDDYNVAYNFYREHQWEHAGEAFRKFVATYPDHERTPAARLYQGLCLVQERKFAPARDIFRTFAQKHPQHPDLYLALYRIGECSYFLGDSAAAKTELDRFISTFPRNDLAQWALQYLADTHLRLKDPHAAMATLRLQLERFPQGELADDARFLTGRTPLAIGDRDAAMQTFRQLASKEAGLRIADAHIELGMLLYEEGQHADARDNFDAVRARFPQSPLVGMADLNAGYACYHLADYDGAIARFEHAAQVPAQTAEATFWKGMSLKSKGAYPEAVATFDALANSAAGTPIAEKGAFHAADAELRRGSYAAAQARFLKLVDQSPPSALAADALHLATEAALLQGNLDDADRLPARFERDFAEQGLGSSLPAAIGPSTR